VASDKNTHARTVHSATAGLKAMIMCTPKATKTT